MKGAHVLKSMLAALVLLCVLGGMAYAEEGSAESAKDPKPDPAMLAKLGNSELIAELVKAGGTGAGFSPYFTGSQFLPLDDQAEFHTGILGAPRPEKDPVLTEIVKRGPKIVAELIKALGDKRATKIILKHEMGMGGMWHDSEYERNWRTAKPLKTKEDPARDPTEIPDSIKEYTLCVGDLCFVALGQIVNRGFSAVRYQPTACIVLNSPVQTPVLRKWAEEEWASAEEASALKSSLLSDLSQPYWEDCRSGAYKRLAYYFPDAVDEPVLKFLQLPRYGEDAAWRLRDKLLALDRPEDWKEAYVEFAKAYGVAAPDGLRRYLIGVYESGKGKYASDEHRKASEHARSVFKVLLPDFDPDKPYFPAYVGHSVYARFVNGLVFDSSEKVDQCVIDELKECIAGARLANDRNYIAFACINRLILRQRYDKIILQYLDKFENEDSERVEEFKAVRARLKGR